MKKLLIFLLFFTFSIIAMEKPFDEKQFFQALQDRNAYLIDKILSTHPSIKLFDEEENTPWNTAINNRDMASVTVLLDHGLDINQQNRSNGQTPLMIAINTNQPDLMRLLIEQHADLNRTDACGRTALFYALLQANESMVRILLEHGATVNLRDNRGLSVLTYAIQRMNESGDLVSWWRIISLLLQFGAPVTPELIQVIEIHAASLGLTEIEVDLLRLLKAFEPFSLGSVPGLLFRPVNSNYQLLGEQWLARVSANPSILLTSPLFQYIVGHEAIAPELFSPLLMILTHMNHQREAAIVSVVRQAIVIVNALLQRPALSAGALERLDSMKQTLMTEKERIEKLIRERYVSPVIHLQQYPSLARPLSPELLALLFSYVLGRHYNRYGNTH